ncbi:MAG: hypothetical protein IJ025_00375 [Clostridia bacterium]|nr:hypothetical protein [Clostridia bacterium]
MKKLVSFLLAAVMVFSLVVPSVAQQSAAADYDGCPVIIVRGIDFAGLTYEDGSKALNVELTTIFPLVMQSFFARLNVIDENIVIDTAMDVAYEILSPLACDNEGNSVEAVSMVQYPGSMANYPEFVANLTDGAETGIVKTAVEKYGAENTYFFTYDWRKTPQQLADELKSFVDTAKVDSGKEQVNIICASMGGMVTTAYMYYHGTESLNSVVYLSGAHNGTYVCGEALNGRIVFESDVLLTLIYDASDNNLFLRFFLGVFDALGVFDYITGVANDIVADSFDKANDMVLRECFGTLCGFWALCPDDDFESGVKTIFGGHEDEYPVLLEKIEETKAFVFSTEETLTAAMNSGVKISFVSNYNGTLVPVHAKADVNGDGVLETELTSNFATVAPFGKCLTKEQIAGVNKKYISRDNVINASTALFPENTWFVKDAPHVAADYGTGFSDFTFTLLESEEQPDVDMFTEYPRFMIADENLCLYPLS